MSRRLNFHKALADFLKSPRDIDIIYRSSASFVESKTSGICVLDSSFNPPHLGHYALIKEAMRHFQSIGDLEKEKSVLLLLSVKNADKVNPQPEPFDKRLEMMFHMANYLQKSLGLKIGIALTKHARFVDKSIAILDYLRKEYKVSTIKLTFLVGFDTLVRILDPKYYLPDKLTTSLEDFMNSADLFCLTRNVTSFSLKDQSTYLDDINQGKFLHIPAHWSDSIVFPEHADQGVSLISSSSIRKNIRDGKSDWINDVIPEIKDMIIDENLYKS
ncbi:uncharacterized protein PRCAT00006146001 [Priceomyces carsonii]|uniref:uncharacterized protein n=1 Tax=Priceomyces carsonii TaxID=28549 RepID=UPI002ED9A0CA|nr:unnamed protein product [Priceomyces carsonii]